MNKLNFKDLIKLTKCNSTHINHPYKFCVKSAKCNPYKHYFPIQTVGNWNSLPGSTVEARSLSHYKSVLRCFLNIFWPFVLFIHCYYRLSGIKFTSCTFVEVGRFEELAKNVSNNHHLFLVEEQHITWE